MGSLKSLKSPFSFSCCIFPFNPIDQNSSNHLGIVGGLDSGKTQSNSSVGNPVFTFTALGVGAGGSTGSAAVDSM